MPFMPSGHPGRGVGVLGGVFEAQARQRQSDHQADKGEGREKLPMRLGLDQHALAGREPILLPSGDQIRL
jgi:hypothetical protein